MTTIKPVCCILFDVDGVLTLPEEVFSVMYAKSRGLDIKPFTDFFENEWVNYVTGKKDLKQHITDNPNFWRWTDSPDELLDYWFRSEDMKNEELLSLIEQLREQGAKCYIATEQEKYRTDYMRETMFNGMFDGIFSTCEIGYKKNNPAFFETIISRLKEIDESITPSDLLFFDDSQSKVDAATSVGIDARLYISTEQIRSLLDQ